jgi:hypothetical protein
MCKPALIPLLASYAKPKPVARHAEPTPVPSGMGLPR